MAKGQYLSSYQQGIVKRFYANFDGLQVQKLQELVSELYLADAKAAEKLWKRAGETLVKADPELQAKAAKIVAAKDVKAFAALVGELSAPTREAPRKR